MLLCNSFTKRKRYLFHQKNNIKRRNQITYKEKKQKKTYLLVFINKNKSICNYENKQKEKKKKFFFFLKDKRLFQNNLYIFILKRKID
jgi:hypothetical protein